MQKKPKPLLKLNRKKKVNNCESTSRAGQRGGNNHDLLFFILGGFRKKTETRLCSEKGATLLNEWKKIRLKKKRAESFGTLEKRSFIKNKGCVRNRRQGRRMKNPGKSHNWRTYGDKR